MATKDDSATLHSRLTRAVSSWLSYKTLTGLEGLINEASLSVPIAEFLTHNTKYEILGQEDHPQFGNRKLDFVAKKRGSDSWVFAVETKSLPLGDPQRFVDDILRLALLNRPGVRRYFLVAGKLSEADWKRLKVERDKAKGKVTGPLRVPFRRLINVKGSARCDVVGLFLRNDYHIKSVDLTKIDKLVGEYVRDFKERYEPKTIPGRYVTELKSWNRKNRFVAAIWEIKIKQGKAIFSS
jgi:hypothetical protein